MMAKLFAVASISIQSSNCAATFYSTARFPVVNTRQRILLLWYKSLVIRRTSRLLCLLSVALFGKKILNKKHLKGWNHVKLATPVGCKQAREDFHFNSTWRKTWVTANGSNSPACVSTKSTFESKSSLSVWIKEFTLLSSPNRRERGKKTCCLGHNVSLWQTERKLTN